MSKNNNAQGAAAPKKSIACLSTTTTQTNARYLAVNGQPALTKENMGGL
jgi:hypothetical protein